MLQRHRRPLRQTRRRRGERRRRRSRSAPRGGAQRPAHRPRQGHDGARGGARAAGGGGPRSRASSVLEEHTADRSDHARQVRRAGGSAPALTCSTSAPGAVETILARSTILATGGACKVYLYTTNPDVATGDGIAMAFRAGGRDLQHGVLPVPPHLPSSGPQARRTSSSREALRGEGPSSGALDGTAFMKEYDPRLELAPRDIVARAIDFDMKKHRRRAMRLPRHHRQRSRRS